MQIIIIINCNIYMRRLSFDIRYIFELNIFYNCSIFIIQFMIVTGAVQSFEKLYYILIIVGLIN